jgi:hypothetical protein
MGRLPAYVPRITTSREAILEVADIPLCSGLQVCSPPRSFLPLRILPQGSRGFYIRAYRALLPPHAPDMLTVRTQVIDGTGTCTLSDFQPCRLLPPPRRYCPRFRPPSHRERWHHQLTAGEPRRELRTSRIVPSSTIDRRPARALQTSIFSTITMARQSRYRDSERRSTAISRRSPAPHCRASACHRCSCPDHRWPFRAARRCDPRGRSRPCH